MTTDAISFIYDKDDEEGRTRMYSALEDFFTRTTDSVVDRFALACSEIEDEEWRSRVLGEMYLNLGSILRRRADELDVKDTLLMAERTGR